MAWFTGTLDWLIAGVAAALSVLIGGWLLVRQLTRPRYREPTAAYVILFALVMLAATAAVVVAGVLFAQA